MKVMTSDIPADCQGVKGVAHHSPAPINTVRGNASDKPLPGFIWTYRGCNLMVAQRFPPNVLQYIADLCD